MNPREQLINIFKENRQLAELNADLAAEVMANPAFPAPVRRQKARQAKSLSRAIAAQPASKAPWITPSEPLVFTVPGDPVPKARQTKSDKWKKRPAVVRARTWADEARAAYNNAKRKQFPDVRFLGVVRYGRVDAIAFFGMPPSWNAATKTKMKGQPHTIRPDADNLAKNLLDSLWPTGDEHVFDARIRKFWDDGAGPRTVIRLLPPETIVPVLLS